MHVFLSVGEPSGDQHAAHLIHELRRRRPDIRFSGFGGPLMAQAGCREVYRLTNLAVMGFGAVLPLLWTFYKLVREAGRLFREERPDAVLLVDFPGFNWWVARQAKKAGIPVYYYMPPQLWAWAPWRIRKARRLIDCVFAALPFEAEWYRQRGVNVEYVGHPFFDEIAQHPIDEGFCRSLRATAAQSRTVADAPVRVMAILPGSRRHEVERNFPVMLKVMKNLAARHPGLRFAVACYKESHRDYCRELLKGESAHLPAELHLGRTSDIIADCDCCLMVSGSVSLEVFARAKPAAVVYRCGALMYTIAMLMVTSRFITLPNLIAGRLLMPEYPFTWGIGRRVRRLTSIFDRWLSSEAERELVSGEMRRLRDSIVRQGGVARCAEALLAKLPQPNRERLAA